MKRDKDYPNMTLVADAFTKKAIAEVDFKLIQDVLSFLMKFSLQG